MDSREVLRRMREAERKRIPLLLAKAQQAVLEGRDGQCDALCAEAEEVAQREAALGDAIRALDEAAVASAAAVSQSNVIPLHPAPWLELAEGQRWEIAAEQVGVITVEILAIDSSTGEVDIVAERGRASCQASLSMRDAMMLFEGARLLDGPLGEAVRH